MARKTLGRYERGRAPIRRLSQKMHLFIFFSAFFSFLYSWLRACTNPMLMQVHHVRAINEKYISPHFTSFHLIAVSCPAWYRLIGLRLTIRRSRVRKHICRICHSTFLIFFSSSGDLVQIKKKTSKKASCVIPRPLLNNQHICQLQQ